MRKRSKPLCLYCGNKPARNNSFFCSYRCGADWADAFLLLEPIAFCYECDKWMAVDPENPKYLKCKHKTVQ